MLDFIDKKVLKWYPANLHHKYQRVGCSLLRSWFLYCNIDLISEKDAIQSEGFSASSLFCSDWVLKGSKSKGWVGRRCNSNVDPDPGLYKYIIVQFRIYVLKYEVRASRYVGLSMRLFSVFLKYIIFDMIVLQLHICIHLLRY